MRKTPERSRRSVRMNELLECTVLAFIVASDSFSDTSKGIVETIDNGALIAW